MRLHRSKPKIGYFKHPSWVPGLVIVCADGFWRYLHNNSIVGSVLEERDDFILCDREGNPLTKTNKQENGMNNVNYIGGDYKVVECIYEKGGKKYCFKIDIDVEVEKDNTLVVESSNGLGIVTVVSVLDNTFENADKVNKATAWVVDKVDMTKQNARRDATKQRDFIMKRLEEKKSQMEALTMYKLLAEHDPEAGKLLEQLKQLGS